MSDAAPITPTTEQLQISRERITAIIGVSIVAVSLVLLILAWVGRGDDEAWDRTKDLLLYVEGLVGVVLGYYFGRTPAEARAGAAERGAELARREADAARRDHDANLDEIASIVESNMREAQAGGADPRVLSDDALARLRAVANRPRRR